MHFDTPAREPDDHAGASWWRELTRYQWFVFLVASLGWLFDTMDQQLFTMARKPAVTRLLDVAPGDPTATGRVDEYGGYATTVFMIGWAIGGIVFGILGDKVGRAKTMMMTVLFYSAFTGLSALSTGIWDFAFYRFLTGLGVGGQFAVGGRPRGRSDVGQGPAIRAGVAAGALVGRQHAGGLREHRPGQTGRIRSNRQRLAAHVPGRPGPCPLGHTDLRPAQGA